jgi:hypothetical protein
MSPRTIHRLARAAVRSEATILLTLGALLLWNWWV